MASPISSNTVGSANVAGTRFQNISNPYSNMPRQRTKWDNFLNWLGFRSGYDKAQEQYNLAGAEYNAQLEQLASEEAYNSPVQQAARMRAAGLNPDLTGVSGEPASEFDNQQESPDISVGPDVNPIDVVKDVGQGFISAFTGAIGLLSDINLLKQARIETDSKDLDYQNKMLQFFKDTDSLFRSPSDEGSVVSTLVAPGFFRSSRNMKRFNRYRGTAGNSLLALTQGYKSYDDFAKSAKSLGTEMSQPYFNGFARFSPQDVADFLKPISKAQLDLIQAQIKADNARAYSAYNKEAYTGDVYGELNKNLGNAKEEASAYMENVRAEMAESGMRQSIAPMTVTRNKIINGMIQSIDAIPDKTLGHKILKFFLVNQLSGSLLGQSDLLNVASKVLPKVL